MIASSNNFIAPLIQIIPTLEHRSRSKLGKIGRPGLVWWVVMIAQPVLRQSSQVTRVQVSVEASAVSSLLATIWRHL